MRPIFVIGAALLAAGSLGAVPQQRPKWIGHVSDVQCGKAVNAECNRKCVRAGEAPVLVVDGTDDVMPILNPDTLKAYAGEYVEVEGQLVEKALKVIAVKRIETSAASAETAASRYLGDYRISRDHVIGIDSFVGDDGKRVLLYSDYKTGVVRRLFQESNDVYYAGPGFAVRSPAEFRVRFVSENEGGTVSRLIIQQNQGGETTAARMPTTEKEVHFQSGDATLAGTLVMPESKGLVPAIVLLHGSGPLTRDSFGPYPRFFVSLGFAVLIYDKRGTGSSTGEYLSTNAYYPQPFVQDAVAAIHFMKSQGQIAGQAVGLWGSSEGGMVTTQVAAQTKDVAFIINSSGFMMPLWEEMLFNREAQLRADGFPEPDVLDAVEYQKLLFLVGQTGKGWEEIETRRKKFENHPWFPLFFENQTPSVQSLQRRWQHVYAFDPLPALAKVRCPVLGLFGDLDTSTPAAVAAENMRRVLSQAGNTDFSLKILRNANHSLTQATTGADTENATAKGQAPELFETLRSWLSRWTVD